MPPEALHVGAINRSPVDSTTTRSHQYSTLVARDLSHSVANLRELGCQVLWLLVYEFSSSNNIYISLNIWS